MLRELVRVLRPGSWLLITNRIGWRGALIFGKSFSRRGFERLLQEVGLQEVEILPWQVEYDLAWARKPFLSSKPMQRAAAGVTA